MREGVAQRGITAVILAVLAAVAALTSALPARADILFLDLNGSANEVAGARAAAKARGEKLIVIPGSAMPEKLGMRVDELRRKAASLRAQHDQLETDSTGARTPTQQKELESLDQQASGLEKKADQLAAPYTVSIESLRRALQAHEEGHPITALVVSGHSGGEDIHGNNGDISRSQILDIYEHFPRGRAALKSVVLLGCYTGTRFAVMSWKARMPQLQMIAGYDDRGALGSRPAARDYVRFLLSRQADLTRAADLTEAKRLIDAIPNIGKLNAAVAIGSCYVSVKNGVADLSKEPQDCPILRDRVMSFVQLIQDYLYPSDEAHANPPEDTGHGPLRKLYSTLQQMAHCDAAWREVLPTPQQVRNLIFFRNVMKNYGRYYRQELADLSAILPKIQVTPPLALPDLEGQETSRREVVDFYNRLETVIYDDHHELAKLSDSEKELLERAHDRMGTFFIMLQCAPLSWVEDYGERPVEDPTCNGVD